ncbi:MAG: PAS domain-containing protein [Rhodobacteraceae bacterium]|nr:PAS domain-containing protein [Paracoccaceae bacterium]
MNLADRADAGPAGHPALARLWRYWQALRRPGVLPDRAAVDPRRIEDVLEFAFVAERIAPGEVRLRVAGSHLAALFGCEVRGMPLSAFILPQARADVAAAVEAAVAHPAMVALSLESPAAFGCPQLRAGLLVLPLSDERGQVSRVLGGLAAEGSVGRAPRRFRLLGARVTPCARDGAGSPLPPSAGAAGRAPAAPARRAPVLRLVHSRP